MRNAILSKAILISLICAGALTTSLALAAQTPANQPPKISASPPPMASIKAGERPFDTETLGSFDQPWAMAFLPDGRALITERGGKLRVHVLGGDSGEVSGVPAVAFGGQGGLGDVALHPQFASNGIVYLSYAEAGENKTYGAAIARAKLELDESGGGALSDVSIIWRQVPKLEGRGHYAHRMLFDAEGLLFVSSGDRQHFDPAQDMQSNLGKILRLNDDGTSAAGNPFADQGGVAAQIWSLGHRNPLGIDFDSSGQLWNIEMGPKGGDEFNRVERGANYGYPIVSNGDHYNGKNIPDHDTRPEFNAPAVSWTPVISPGDFIFYSGDVFPGWKNNALAVGLSSEALVRIEISGSTARELERFAMGKRIREIEQGPDGNIFLLEDGSKGRLLKLKPKS